MLVTNSGPSRECYTSASNAHLSSSGDSGGRGLRDAIAALGRPGAHTSQTSLAAGTDLPGLKNFSRITYIVQVVLGLLWLFGQSGLKRPFWLALIFNSGIQLVRSWIRQRVSPDASEIKLYEGWWPAKKDF